ncbi:MAG: DUF2326 domain-containing protein, partial [Campylobacterota bacterium]|nr:DUF2326 domain-containing protein [Campylobacterota bacterium]
SDYIDFLDKLLDIDYTFRNIFGRFFRTNSESYIEAVNQVTTKENGYNNNIINSYLLELDLEFLEKKKLLKIEDSSLRLVIKELKALQKNVDKEKEIELSEKLKNIESNLSKFTIEKNFNELKQEADVLTSKLQKIRNNIAYKNREIRNKKNIINVNHQIDIDLNKIKGMYAEANFFLNEDILNHIDAVKEFHETLFKNRKNKALKDIDKLERNIAEAKDQSIILDNRRSEIFKYLENKGALEEYHSLNQEKDSIKETLEEMGRNEKSINKFKKDQADIKLKIDKFKRELIDFEEQMKEKISFLGKSFREISEEFYDDKPGFLNIEILDKFNTEKLYKIEPEIKGDGSDGSDGIKEMKIFIYDMLIYKLNQNLIGLVGHDNRLFDMVDERQIAKVFEYTNKNISQYICSISDTKFKEAKLHSEIDLDKYVIKNLNEKKKLFGFDFDK